MLGSAARADAVWSPPADVAERLHAAARPSAAGKYAGRRVVDVR